MGSGILSNCKLLLERFFGGKFLTALSTEKGQNFSPTLDLCLPPFSNNPYVIVGSCNGVLCLDDHNGRVVLWNPSNGARKELPQSSLQIDPLADDHGFYCSGFGFDCKYTDYKVVRFLQSSFEVDDCYDHCKQQIEIYSYNRDSWKEIFVPCEVYIHYDNSIYLNGVYYWKAFSEDGKVFVLSFNFIDEKFRRISLPKSLRRPFECCVDLLEFNGLLAVCAYPIEGTEKSFKVWVSNEKLWTEECSIDPIYGVEMPLGFWKNGQEMFFEGSHHELLLYDRATRKLKPLHIHNNTGDERSTMQLIPYVESSELEELVIEIHQSEAHQASASPSARAPASTAAHVTEPGSVVSSIAASESDVNSQAASNLDGESNLEGAIQRILDMGGRTWERDIVVNALHATDNNPERAVEYLYSMLESTHTSSLLKRKKYILPEQPPSKAPRVDHEEVLHFLGLDGRSRKLKWYVLDVNRGKRITRVKMPNDVPCGSTAIAYLNHLYLIGGDDETCISDGIDDPFPALKRVLCFDLDNPEKGWTYAPPMSFGRFYPTVVAFNGKIYAFGGSRRHFAEFFDIIQSTWAELKPPCDPFYPTSPVLLDSSHSRILVHCFLNHSLYAYNMADESWECLNENYGEWSRHSVVVDGVIYSLVFDDYFTLSLRAYGVDEKKELGIKCVLSGDEVRATKWGCHLYHLGNHKLCLAGYDGVERCIRYEKFSVPQCKNSRQIGDGRDPASELLQSIKLKASIWKFV